MKNIPTDITELKNLIYTGAKLVSNTTDILQMNKKKLKSCIGNEVRRTNKL